MRSPIPKTIPLLIASAILLPASGAWAAPAGDEYLPGIPKAEGGSGSPSSEAGTATSSGTVPSDSSGAAETEKKGKNDRKEGKNDRKDGSENSERNSDAVALSSGDDSGGSSGFLDTLLDPVVLLLILGVGITAVGMTLRRRQPEPGGKGPDRSRQDPANAPHTPDGEIVSGNEQTSS